MPITPFMKMFGQSPFKLLQKHMNIAIEAPEMLVAFVRATEENDWASATQYQQKIARIENEADIVKKDIRSHLPKSLFLPVSRGDLLALLSTQDKIPNLAKDIAGIMLGRKMRVPSGMEAAFSQLLTRSISACKQAHKAINELDELLESGFRGNEIHVVDHMIRELDKIETETDQLQIDLRQQLFLLEKELPPVEVMFLYNIIQTIGGLADCAHDVGGKLQILLAH